MIAILSGLILGVLMGSALASGHYVWAFILSGPEFVMLATIGCLYRHELKGCYQSICRYLNR